jgi:hypothetical protein
MDMVLDLIGQYPQPRVHGHRPDCKVVLALLVKSILCRRGASFDRDPRDLLLSILRDNYMSDFIYSNISSEIYEHIQHRLKLVFPNFNPYNGHYSFDYEAIEVRRFGMVVIYMTQEHWRRVGKH